MLTAHKKIEQQLTVLLRRSVRIHMMTQHDDLALERSAYAILSKLADEGPQRLGVLAAAFGLDSSTITRQVRALEQASLAVRERDPSDGRVFLLRLTDHGRDVLRRTRRHRRARLQQALVDWSDVDLEEFGRLLHEFNASLQRLDGNN
jgi:DNA-binding MarR family transcriptional regulator